MKRRFRRDRERELDDEIQAHLRRAIEERIEDGMSPASAELAARREFGSVALVKDVTRDVLGWSWRRDIGQDVRYAYRSFVRERSLALAAVTALALCIGASATTFAVVNVLTRGLPVEQPEQLVQLGAVDRSNRPLRLSYREYEALSDAGILAGVAAYRDAGMNISESRRSPEPVSAAYVSANAFQVLGDRPMLGRDFQPRDDRIGAEPVLVLGARVWRNSFAGDPTIVGRTVFVNDSPAVVIGVMPDGFRFPMVTDLWMPLSAMAGTRDDPDSRALNVFGRLTDVRAIDDARQRLDALAARLTREHPGDGRDVRFHVARYGGDVSGSGFFAGLLGAGGLLVLIGCANVAHLLLARTVRRTHETAVRLSQGATRWRLVRSSLVESALLAGAGGILGLVLAAGGFRLLAGNLAGINFPYWQRWTLDATVLVFVAAVTMASALLSSLGAAVQLSRTELSPALKEGGRSATGSTRVRRWTTGLMVSELALTLVLIAGAGLMVRSFTILYGSDLSIDSSRVLLTRVSLPADRYPDEARQAGLFAALRDRVDALPGIVTVTVAGSPPFIGAPRRALTVDSADDAPLRATVSVVPITAGYWELMGLRLVHGRAFSPVDGSVGHEAAIVNERLAAMLFPGRDPIGSRIGLSLPDAEPAGPWLTIVGVAPNVRHQQTFDLQDLDPVVYVPRRGGNAGWLMVRAADDDFGTVTSLIREELAALDPALPLAREMVPLERYRSQSQWPNRVFAGLFAAFAWISIVLAVVGLYAVTAYSVARRRREIGIRMALGARAGTVIWLFLRGAILPLAAGLAAGLVGVRGMGGLLRSFLVRTTPQDPATLLATLALLVTTVFLACWWPARRASRLNPADVLRSE